MISACRQRWFYRVEFTHCPLLCLCTQEISVGRTVGFICPEISDHGSGIFQGLMNNRVFLGLPTFSDNTQHTSVFDKCKGP